MKRTIITVILALAVQPAEALEWRTAWAVLWEKGPRKVSARPAEEGVRYVAPASPAVKLGNGVLRVPSSPHPSQKRRLNPYFEEWLMGLPIGWTGFAAMGLESYPSWRRRLSSIWPRVLG